VDAELKLKELTATGLDDNNQTVKAQAKLLAGLSKVIDELERRIHETNAKEKYEANKQELEAKWKGDEIKRQFLQKHVELLEYQMQADLRTGVQIGTMQNEYERLKGRASDLEDEIRKLQHTRSRLEASGQQDMLITDLDAELKMVQNNMRALYNKMREISLEDLPTIQQRWVNRGRESAVVSRDLEEVKFRCKVYEDKRDDEIKAVYEKEKASTNAVRIDLSTRDGLKLQAYYKQQVDAELKLKELTATGLDDNNQTVKAQAKLLAGLSKDIDELERRVRETNAKGKYEASKREHEAMYEADKIKKDFLQKHVDLLQYQVTKDLETVVNIGTMQNDYEKLKSRASDLEDNLREQMNRRNQPEGQAALPTGDRLDAIIRELTKLRKDVADLKHAAKK
jgi:hypothetical protein